MMMMMMPFSITTMTIITTIVWSSSSLLSLSLQNNSSMLMVHGFFLPTSISSTTTRKCQQQQNKQKKTIFDDKKTTTALFYKNDQQQQSNDVDNVAIVDVDDNCPFIVSSSSLRHLENTELPDDHLQIKSTDISIETWEAISYGVGCSIVASSGGIIAAWLYGSLLEDKITRNDVVIGIGLLVIGFAFGFYILGNGQNAIEIEKLKRRPINGGYDRKSLADRPIRLKTIMDYFGMSTTTTSTITTEGDDDIILDTHIPTPTTRNSSTSESSSSSSSWLYERVYPYAKQVHSEEYLQLLEMTSNSTDNRPIRLNPRYSRTLIDQHSFDASLQAAADWMASVDNALLSPSSKPNIKPKMALVRPPSHHACQSMGMGGCLLNSVSIAALYALDRYEDSNIKTIAILDIDAHHGNGIAHCIQDFDNIRYCSIHEQVPLLRQKSSQSKDNNPRSSEENDFGPLNNICNFCLPPNTGWDTGYSEILEQKAIPFLKYGNDGDGEFPDLLLIAAGFDALEADWTSTLQLQPNDYYEIGQLLKQNFPHGRIAMGLEGGYSWESGDLPIAIDEFMKPWYID